MTKKRPNKGYKIPDSIRQADKNYLFEVVKYIDETAGMKSSDYENRLIISYYAKGKAIYKSIDHKNNQIVLPNNVLVTQPNEEHHLYLDKADCDEQFICIFNETDFCRYVASILHTDVELLDDPELQQKYYQFPSMLLRDQWDIIHQMKTLHQLLKNDEEPADPLFIHLSMFDILNQVIRYSLSAAGIQDTQITQPTSSIAKEIQHRITQVQVYIRDNYANNMGLNELANVSNMSKYHFLRQFKIFTGKTPYQFLIQIRLEKAKHFLLETPLDVDEIVYATGFQSRSSFYKQFNTDSGMTPTQFRDYFQKK